MPQETKRKHKKNTNGQRLKDKRRARLERARYEHNKYFMELNQKNNN